MSAVQRPDFSFEGEQVTATRYPASDILVLMISPNPPMPPVMSASRFAMSPLASLIRCRPRLCSGIIAPKTEIPVIPDARSASRNPVSSQQKPLDSRLRGNDASHHVQAAVDRDIRAGDVPRLVGGEVGYQARDLLGPREPPHGNLPDDRIQDFGLHRPNHVGLDVAW